MRERAPRARAKEAARGRRARTRFAPALAAPFLLLAATVAYAATTFLVVSPTNLQGWQTQVTTAATMTPTPSVTFVTGPGTPPLGTGSVEFRVGANGNDTAQLRHPGFAGTRLPNPSATATPAANELTALSYSTFTQQDGSGGQSPYIILQIDTDGDADSEDLLFFEPVYQSATFCPSNPQPALVTGQWQTWDAFNGCWYSFFGTAGSGPGTNTKPLRTLSAALPTGQIANSSPSGLGGVRIVTGPPGAGAWGNYVGNADAFRIGVGANDTVYNFEPNQTSPTSGSLIISEVRFRGPNGLEDEFVEIYNNSSSPHVVAPPDGSGGYALVGSDGVVRGSIPFGEVIPARGHYLFANSDGYSLTDYPAGAGASATPDASYTADLPNDATAGVALFATDNSANFGAGTILDAFGFTGAPAIYREGTGFPTAVADSTQHTYFRDLRGGPPKDSGNNAQDFMLVSTAPATTGGGARLGAPGPENLSSPVQRNDKIKSSLIDRLQPYSAEPNSVRRQCSPMDPLVEECNPNRSLDGTFSIRRRWTNGTGEDVTRLRFRLVNVTTGPTPAAGTADLRAITSGKVTVTTTGGAMVTVEGTTVEEITPTPSPTPSPRPPSSQPFGGGYNSTLAVGTIDLTSDPLVPNEEINLQFLFGVQQGGAYAVFVNVEAGPSPSSGTLAPARASSQPSKGAASKGGTTRRR